MAIQMRLANFGCASTYRCQMPVQGWTPDSMYPVSAGQYGRTLLLLRRWIDSICLTTSTLTRTADPNKSPRGDHHIGNPYNRLEDRRTFGITYQ